MQHTTLDTIRAERISKLEKLSALGPLYPSTFVKKSLVSECLASQGKEVSTAGRLLSFREHGKIAFAKLQDETGTIQIFFQNKLLSEKENKKLKLIDIGDIVGVAGKVDKTSSGELSIFVEKFEILTKAIRPLPSSWFGLEDQETRYRKRYLDTILDPAVMTRFKIRSKLVSSIRRYLESQSYVEVETPVLQSLYGGANAAPFTTHLNALDIDMYLHIAVELYLKRCIIGGMDRVFEIARDFRNEGVDLSHSPEFTMLEFYEAYADYHRIMDVTEGLLKHCAQEIFGSQELKVKGEKINLSNSWPRIEMTKLVLDNTGLNYDKNTLADFQAYAKDNKIEFSPDDSKAIVMYKIFDSPLVAKKLIGPIWVLDYPIEISPLSKKHPDKDGFTQRFECYMNGIEVCDGWTELNDPADQRQRFLDQQKGQTDPQPLDEDFIEAMEYGMPPTGGIGIGIERLTMFFTDTWSIREVQLYPLMRPKNQQKLVPQKTPSQAKKFTISPEVLDKLPGMKVGYAILEMVNIKKSNPDLEKLKKDIVLEKQKLTEEDINNIPTIASYRRLFKSFGVDWKSRHPSPDALLRRIVSGKPLYNVNTLVDAYNVASLETSLGFGAMDMDHLVFPVELRFSAAGEKIILLGGQESKTTDEGELIYADQEKLITLDLNYRDCDQTKITEETKSVIIFVDGTPDMSRQQLETGLDLAVELITKFCGGKLIGKEFIEQ